VTTVEQTLIDLISRPELGGAPDAAREGISALMARADVSLLRQLAAAQRRRNVVDDALQRHGVA
jgi:hypothetical protein